MHTNTGKVRMDLDDEITIDLQEKYSADVLMSLVQNFSRSVLLAERGKTRKSQNQFALEDKFDMSSPQISKYESGNHDFNLLPFIKLLCSSEVPVKVKINFTELEEYLESNFKTLPDQESKNKAARWSDQFRMLVSLFNQQDLKL